MNAAAPDPTRRRLLGRLFGQKAAEPVSSLKPVSGVGGSGRNVFWSMAATGADNVFLAGDEGCLWHFDGSEWQREDTGTKSNLHALCCSEDKVLAVGWQGVICVRETGEWRVQQGGGTEAVQRNLPLFALAADDRDAFWAVGDCGRIACYRNGVWLEESSGSNANLRSVLPLKDGRVLAGGLGGTLLQRDAGQWHEVSTPTGCP